MAVLPHLEIGKLRDFYSDEISRTWMSAIKDSGLVAHDGEPLSYKKASQDYLDKNKHLYAKVLKSADENILGAARVHAPEIDTEIIRIERSRAIEDKSINSSSNDAETTEGVEPKRSDIVASNNGNGKSRFSMMKLATTTALLGALGVGSYLYNEDQNEKEHLTNLFEDAAYTVINPSSTVEKCVIDNTIEVAVDAVRDAEGASEVEFTRHVWPNFKEAVYSVSDECGDEYGNKNFKLSETEISNLAISLNSVMKNNL